MLSRLRDTTLRDEQAAFRLKFQKPLYVLRTF